MSDSVWPHRRQPTKLPCPWDSPGKNTGVGCHFLLQCMKVKSENEVAQSSLTLSDTKDCSLPGSSIHGIFQARVLEWGAIAFSDIYISDIYIYRHIYGNVICNSPKLDTILISFIRWMVKWTVAHPYQKILLCNGKEQTIDTYRMTLHRIILNEKTQPHDSTYVIFLKSQNQRNGKD